MLLVGVQKKQNGFLFPVSAKPTMYGEHTSSLSVTLDFRASYRIKIWTKNLTEVGRGEEEEEEESRQDQEQHV